MRFKQDIISKLYNEFMFGIQYPIFNFFPHKDVRYYGFLSNQNYKCLYGCEIFKDDKYWMKDNTKKTSMYILHITTVLNLYSLSLSMKSEFLFTIIYTFPYKPKSLTNKKFLVQKKWQTIIKLNIHNIPLILLYYVDLQL